MQVVHCSNPAPDVQFIKRAFGLEPERVWAVYRADSDVPLAYFPLDEEGTWAADHMVGYLNVLASEGADEAACPPESVDE